MVAKEESSYNLGGNGLQKNKGQRIIEGMVVKCGWGDREHRAPISCLHISM